MATVKNGFVEKLWQIADILRGNIDASENKNVLLGLFFLKFISNPFEENWRHIHQRLNRGD